MTSVFRFITTPCINYSLTEIITHIFFLKVTLNHGRPVPAVLLANKSDQVASQVSKLDSFCRENGCVGWFETSAKVRALIHLINGLN